MADQSPIVVGVDGSASSRRAVSWAARDAARRGTRLTLVSTLRPPVLYDGGIGVTPHVFDWGNDESKALLVEAAELADDAVRGTTKLVIDTDLHTGQPLLALLEHAKTAQMVVLGASGPGKFPGALARSVTAHARCSVVVIHTLGGQRPPLTGPVVLGVDRAESSGAAVTAAFEEASLRGTDLVALHAWIAATTSAALPGGNDQDWAIELDEHTVLSASLTRWKQRFPDVPVHQIVVQGTPVHSLVEHSVCAQLIVIGSHPRRGLGIFRPSTARALLRTLDRPLMITRQCD